MKDRTYNTADGPYKKAAKRAIKEGHTIEALIEQWVILYSKGMNLTINQGRNNIKNKLLARKMKQSGCTYREIALALGYKHPGSISNLLKQ